MRAQSILGFSGAIVWILLQMTLGITARDLRAQPETFDLWDNKAPNALVCPEEEIRPCQCYFGGIMCEETVTVGISQADVDRTIEVLRRVNGVGPNDTLVLPGFLFFGTRFGSFNLTSLLRTSTQGVIWQQNYDLTTITGPEPYDSALMGSIQTSQIKFFINALSEEGLGDALKYFDPQSVTSLILYVGGLTGGQYGGEDGTSVEFLPHLSKFTNLEEIDLARNHISEIKNGQFKTHSKLGRLDLNQNWLTASPIFGKDAFLIENPEAEKLFIDMSFNQMSQDTFSHPQNGLASSGARPIALELDYNSEITSLTRESFEPFLLAHPENSMNVNGARLDCDERMTWLRVNASYFQHRIFNTRCSNDGGTDIWETVLIPTP